MKTIEPSKQRGIGIWRYLGGLLGIAIVILSLVRSEWLLSNFETIFFGMAIVAGIQVYIFRVYSPRRRKKYLKELGAGIGLISSPKVDYSAFSLSPKVDYSAFSKKIKWSRLLEWSGFKESEPRKIRYLMQGNIDVADVAIFERVLHRYSRNPDSVTAVLFESDKLSLPGFCLRPEGIPQKIGSALGDPDIDFSEFPNFSSQYLLQGAEEEVRKVFNSNILSYFEHYPGWTVEGFGAQLLVYKRRRSWENPKVPSKKDFQELLQSAITIFQFFI